MTYSKVIDNNFIFFICASRVILIINYGHDGMACMTWMSKNTTLPYTYGSIRCSSYIDATSALFIPVIMNRKTFIDKWYCLIIILLLWVCLFELNMRVVKFQSFVVGSLNDCITWKLHRRLGSGATEMPLRLQSNSSRSSDMGTV